MSWLTWGWVGAGARWIGPVADGSAIRPDQSAARRPAGGCGLGRSWPVDKPKDEVNKHTQNSKP
jgi:hypothetical protein